MIFLKQKSISRCLKMQIQTYRLFHKIISSYAQILTKLHSVMRRLEIILTL